MPKGITQAKEAQNGIRINPAKIWATWLNKGKVHDRPKGGSTSTSQMITWQKQWSGMVGILVNPQTRSKKR